MYLLTIDLYELGQYLRIVLWICLPLTIVSLLVTTWLHYRRRLLNHSGWRLSVEGLDNAMEPEGISRLPDDSMSYHERNSGPASGHHPGREPDSWLTPDPRPGSADNDQWAKEKENISEWKAKDNIYQGILWMKDKYEQYRDQADQRYESLKEELNRSECRYQDLLLSIEANKDSAPGAAFAALEVQYNQARQQIDARQLIIGELEEQLRIERLKVEELVARLQTNSQLLLNIYQELDQPATVVLDQPGTVVKEAE